MRNKTTCTRLIDKLASDFKKLLFILSRPNADAKEFSTIIKESKEIVENVRSFIDREQNTIFFISHNLILFRVILYLYSYLILYISYILYLIYFIFSIFS